MKSTSLLVIAGWLMLASAPAPAEDAAEPIEQRMTPEQFERAGLDKLSPQELDYLNAWLRGDRADETAQAVEEATARVKQEVTVQVQEEVAAQVAEERAGLRLKQSDRRVIESHIVGEFSDWTGNTRFKLANGQIWRQVGSGSNRTKKTVDPKVRIEPKTLGSWKLYVEGSGRGVKVTRIQ